MLHAGRPSRRHNTQTGDRSWASEGRRIGLDRAVGNETAARGIGVLRTGMVPRDGRAEPERSLRHEMLGWMRLAAVLIVVSLVLLGCTDDSEPVAPTDEPTISDEQPIEVAEQPISTGAPSSLDVEITGPADCTGYEHDFLVREGFDRVVQVALVCEYSGELQLVDRVVSVDADQMTAIVEQLFLGVTAEETEAGLQSSFSPYTAGQFDEVRVGTDGVVVVDLGPGFVTANNFSTSFMSGQVFDQIAASMFAVADVTGVEFTFDGRRWCGWEAGPCPSVPQPLIARR